MDAEQFSLLLKTFQASQETLLKTILSQQKPISQPPDPESLSSIAPFENFDASKEKFSYYLERFENFLEIKNVSSAAKKAQLLCASIGSIHYNNLSAFIGPENAIKNLTYIDLVKEFKHMLIPQRSTVVSQHYFLNVIQKDNETIADFVASLRRVLADCDYHVNCKCKQSVSFAEVMLRAQFIRGLRDNWIREQLLQLNSTKFEEFVKRAAALEASRIESHILMNQSPLYPTPIETHKVSKSHQSRHDSGRSLNFQNRSERKYLSSSLERTQGSPSSIYGRSRQINRKGQINYYALGIENLCLRCGKANHSARECRTSRESLSCGSCGKTGHLEKVCISTLIQKYGKQEGIKHFRQYDSSSDYSDNEYGVGKLESTAVLHDVGSVCDKYYVTVTLNGTQQRFEVDSGARYSLLSENDFQSLHLNIPLQSTKISFRTYSDHIIKPKGKVTLQITYKNQSITDDLYVVPQGHDAILGRVWIRRLPIDLKELDEQQSKVNMTPVKSVDTLEQIFREFRTVFEERIGCVPNYEVKLQLRASAKPVFFRERNVPYSLREHVEKELASLEAQNVITPVAASDWGSPLVVIPKADGGVRLCVDYKCGVNEKLVSANHPIRRIDDVLHSLRNSKFFCKLDLHKAYLHLKVDDESSKIQTISTHKGTYRMNRLSFGIKTAPSEFNRILTQILKNLPKTEAYFDDIICHGSSKEECRKNLRACLKRLSEYDLHVNKSKCSFFNESIDYLGHIVEHNKIKKSPEKVKAIVKMSRPTNVDEVRRFLGMATYYVRFIPRFSSVSYPLRRLLKKDQRFIWSRQCESAFNSLKSELCSDRVLVPYDPSLPLILTTDASPTGIAAVISHEINGQERPVAYASRSLSVPETNYSQLDREAVAIVFGVHHFYNYLFGRNFTLVTDNEPLTRIFHHHKALPQMTSARLLRYASFLSGFDYTIKFKKGDKNQNVDCMSRAPVSLADRSADVMIGVEVNRLCAQTLFQISGVTITYDTIRSETSKDPELGQIMLRLQSQSTDEPYTINNGILFKQDRVVIPSRLRQQILDEIHATHLGIMKMKQLARRYVYWPKIDQDIERLVKSCENCAVTRNNPPKAPLHPWLEPEENWERVHIDYAGPFENHHFLLCMDAKSRWAEIKVVKDAPSSTSTMSLLEDIFSTHGYPYVLVSDNASIFTSDTFRNYCKERGIFQKLIAPGHPSTNGLAERNIQTLKHRLRAATNDTTSLYVKVRNILFRYRATPLACGESPADKYLHRRLRIRLDALLPNRRSLKPSIVRDKPPRSFKEGERVMVRLHTDNKDVWQFGYVEAKLGQLHYDVTLDSGRTLKRHIDQLRSTLVPNKCVTFANNTSNNLATPQEPGHSIVGIPVPASTPHACHQQPSEAPEAPSTPPIEENRLLQRPERARKLPKHLNDYQL